MFPDIVRAHQTALEAWLRTQGLQDADKGIVLRESFEELFFSIEANGFPDNIGGKLHSIAEGKLSNYRRIKGREPFSYRAISSRSAPGSAPDMESALDAREAARRVRAELEPELLKIVDMIVRRNMSHSAIAAALGISEGLVKSRWIQAKRRIATIVDKSTSNPPALPGDSQV